MDEVRRAVIQKLEMMEKRAANHVEFWLSHQILLRPDTSTSLLFEFLGISNTSLEKPILSDQCEQCGEDSVFYETHTDSYICCECGYCQHQTRKHYEVFVPESSIYKPSVHLHKLLHEMQCLRHQLPTNIVADVRDYLKQDFSYDRIKKSLRKLGYNQAYAMVYSIQQYLDPTFKPLQLSYEEEEQLQGLFWQYLQLDKMGRKNRLNYHFVLQKFSRMLKYDHLLPFLHPPKGKKSREESEKIWKEVCIRLRW